MFSRFAPKCLSEVCVLCPPVWRGEYCPPVSVLTQHDWQSVHFTFNGCSFVEAWLSGVRPNTHQASYRKTVETVNGEGGVRGGYCEGIDCLQNHYWFLTIRPLERKWIPICHLTSILPRSINLSIPLKIANPWMSCECLVVVVWAAFFDAFTFIQLKGRRLDWALRMTETSAPFDHSGSALTDGSLWRRHLSLIRKINRTYFVRFLKVAMMKVIS